MSSQLARLFGFVAPRNRMQRLAVEFADVPFERYSSNEVSEYHGILLVRLAAGRAMQVQLRGSDVLTRTVPIARAMQMGEQPPWQLASTSCIQAWIQADAAIWRWLVAKGINVRGHNAIPV
jgi:hypothetical protein